MEFRQTAIRRAWLVLVAGAGLMQFAVPALAASGGPTCTAKATVNMASVTMPDFVKANGAWVPNTVEINGTSSQPKTNEGGAYVWSFSAAALGTLTNATTSKGTINAPDVTGSSQQTTVRLTVSSAACGTDFVDIPVTITNAHDVVQNTAPRARPTASPASATEGTLVTLDGSTSSDLENDTLTYAWTQTEGPTVTLSPTDHPAKRTFVAPNFASDTPLTFRLTVSDGKLTGSDVTYVTVGWTNDAPTAALQCPAGVIKVDEGGQVFLDGRASSDPDDGIATYEWQQLVGLPALPDIGTASTATFAAPVLGYQQSGFVPVKLTVTDGSGAKSSADCTIAIQDVSRPLITVPGPLTREATSAAGAKVAYGATAFDAVDGDLPIDTEYFLCEAPSGALFPLDALTPVLCSARDTAGNESTARFDVSVVDTTPPVLDAPASLAREATGPGGAAATYTVKATDLVDGQKDAICTPASGSSFPISAPGPVTTVSCGATDAHGNAAKPVTFEVAIHDTKAPVIDMATVSRDLVTEATSAAGAVATFALPTAHDIVDLGNVTVGCIPASGSTFALGETTVSCDAVDTRGNATQLQTPATSARFRVTVRDTTAPAFAGVPADIVTEALSASGATVTYALPTAMDLVDGVRTVTCAPDTGDVFGLGNTTVTCTTRDTANNEASASFRVTVEDTTAPTLTLPGTLVAEATNPSGAAVAFTAFAVDAVDPSVTFTCSATSGATFAIGTTTVSCSGTDDAGNTSTGSFDVTVQDTIAPVLTVTAPNPVEATGPSGAVVAFSASATDAVGATVSCTKNPGDTFPVGTTAVTCTAADAAGNTTEATFNVAVNDTTAPVLAPHADVTATATGNSSAIVQYTLPTATDLVDGNVPVDCAPASGSSFPVGTTAVTCKATDSRGNVSPSTFNVVVGYAFTGFFQPVDMGSAINSVKAGSAIPVKFSLGGNQGLAIFQAASPVSAPASCTGGGEDLIEETVTAGGSSLQYDATAGQYVYVWKTDKAWLGTCRVLQVKFKDGTSKTAYFKFK